MSSLAPKSILNFPPNKRKIVLSGNPNVGKSLLFNLLTGIYVEVSNFPGTTLEISYAKIGNDLIIDTPGIYGISSFNEEEKAARDIVIEADVVINVVNALHLERDLFLTQQLIDMGKAVVVAVNMMDDAQKKGIKIDIDKLSTKLGVPVVPVIAVKNYGINRLKHAVGEARQGNSLPLLGDMLPLLDTKVRNLDQAEALLILEGDPYIAARNRVKPLDKREEIYLARRKHIDSILADVVRKLPNRIIIFSDYLSRLTLQPVTGIPILILVLWLLYLFIGVFIAQKVVFFTEEIIMVGYYELFIRSILGSLLSAKPIIYQFILGQFGILTTTVTYILGLLLPLVTGFYLSLSIMEDSGYLPRIAVLCDRTLMRIGLNGRGIIPIILGFGCITAAIITTRLTGNKRERYIATFLLALAVPCSAQLAIITSLLIRLGSTFYTFLYIFLLITIFFSFGFLLNKFLPGKSSNLLIDIPPLRCPRLVNIIKKTFNKTVSFIREAVPLFIIGSLIITTLDLTGLLKTIQDLMYPVTVYWLQLPKETANIFIMGFIRRDFGAAGLLSLPLSPPQLFVAILNITIFVPCFASLLAIIKEQGWQEGIIMWFAILILAFTVSGLISQILI